MDRGPDAGSGDPRAGSCLPRAAGGIHRGGAGESHVGDHHDQRLEPAPGRFPRRPSGHASAGRVMTASSNQDAAATFDPLRPRLIRIAYRMLGSVADAEDMVQEAFLRWLDADRDAVREPEA